MTDAEFLCVFFGIRDAYSFKYVCSTSMHPLNSQAYSCIEEIIADWLRDNEQEYANED